MSYGISPFGADGFGISSDDTPPVVIITNVTRTKISDEIGFDSTTITWYSNENGTYQVEVGGTGKGFGYFVESTNCASGVPVDTVVTDDVLEDAHPTLSDGNYRINIYVTDTSYNTTPYEE